MRFSARCKGKGVLDKGGNTTMCAKDVVDQNITSNFQMISVCLMGFLKYNDSFLCLAVEFSKTFRFARVQPSLLICKMTPALRGSNSCY